MALRTSGGVYNRRKSALNRLQEQLKTGTKIALVADVQSTIPLTEGDVKRINKEVAVLTEKVK